MKHQRQQRNKRPSEWVDDEDQEVDDLEHAATFAMVGLPLPIQPTEPTNTLDESNDDDIDIESESDDDKEEGDKMENEQNTANADNEDSDDDASQESDLDWEQALAKMEDAASDEEDNGGRSGARPPKTEHELDAYKIPIQELEQHMHVQLNIETSSSQVPVTLPWNSSRLQVAGHIKHYMAMDRTVVVESSASNPHGNDIPNQATDSAPLDEGSLLLFRPPVLADLAPQPPNQLVPLGRVFEVFGPVSQPLYTIRLPTWTPSNSAPSADKQTEDGKHEVDQATEHPIGEQSPNGTGKEASLKGPPETVSTQNDTTSLPNNTSQIESLQSMDSDPWAPHGKYSEMLLQHQGEPLTVYFVRDEAKRIDTGRVIQISGKGCDASNLYDEEITNANDIDYSDDEEERQAKSKRGRGGNKAIGTHQTTHQSALSRSAPTHSTGPNPLPAGFHQAPAAPTPQVTPTLPGFYSQAPTNMQRYPVSGVPPRFHGNRSAPPSYPGQPSSQPPPPPPPSGSAPPPPAYQY